MCSRVGCSFFTTPASCTSVVCVFPVLMQQLSSAAYTSSCLTHGCVPAGGERARAAVTEAAAGPAKGKSLGFYWGIRGDPAGDGGVSNLTPGVSLQHLQKVAGETAKQSTSGKASSGFYFSQVRAVPYSMSPLDCLPTHSFLSSALTPLP